MKDPRTMTPQEKEAFHQEAESRIAVTKYAKPAADGKPKQITLLGNSRLVKALVQTVRDGGENNLHYHVHSDTVWFVLKGRARFYGVGDKLIAEIGEHETILMPGGARYWFEKAGPDDLELLQVFGEEPSAGEHERINIDAHKDWMKDDKFLQIYEQPAASR